jgi:hypothetical protein
MLMHACMLMQARQRQKSSFSTEQEFEEETDQLDTMGGDNWDLSFMGGFSGEASKGTWVFVKLLIVLYFCFGILCGQARAV